MKLKLAHLAVAGVASCATPQQQAQTQQVINVLCLHDQILQPVAVIVASTAGPTGVAVAQTDAMLVHPAVVAACAAYNAKPIAATPTSISTVTVPAVEAAPVAAPK